MIETTIAPGPRAQGRARGAFQARAWAQLGLGVVAMAMIADLQFAWTLFVSPLDAAHGWGAPAIQTAFAVFIAAETALIPLAAWIVDRQSPRRVAILGGILVAAAWRLDALAEDLAALYLAAAIGGAGAAAVYATCVGNALKWFPRRRGLAAGINAAGYGAGAALTIGPIADRIAQDGYQSAFALFALIQGAVIIIAALGLRPPSEAEMIAAGRRRTDEQDNRPSEVVRTPVFWTLYLAFALMAAGGLTLAAQVAPIAADFGIAAQALTLALTLNRLCDGIGRPALGLLSDRAGREVTLGAAFALAAIAVLLLDAFGRDPIWFAVTTSLFFLAFGAIDGVFHAISGDTFGTRFASTNSALLHTAKGAASLAVPLVSLAAGGLGWHVMFQVFAGVGLIAAALVLFVVRPVRDRFLARHLPLVRTDATPT